MIRPKTFDTEIKTHYEAVLYFIQTLDIGMMDSVLLPDHTYQDFPKDLFIQKLGAAFEEFIKSGDKYLERYPGLCNGKNCNYKCKGFTFIGNKSGNYFNLIIKHTNGFVQDIYECGNFENYHNVKITGNLVWINKLDLDFLRRSLADSDPPETDY